MKRPKQLPAVDRNNITRSAAAPAGVNPSGWLSDVWDAVKTYGPAVGSAIGAIA